MFTNDLFKNGKLGGNENWKKTLIGNKVLIGSNATTSSNIVSGCVIGAGSSHKEL